MTYKVTVTSVHMEHEGGTKDYLLDHIKIENSKAGGNGIEMNHTIKRFGGVGRRHQTQVDHDPDLSKFDKTRREKNGRGYSAAAGRVVKTCPSLEDFEANHGELSAAILTTPALGPELRRLCEQEKKANRKPVETHAIPAAFIPEDDVTSANPNLGMF